MRHAGRALRDGSQRRRDALANEDTTRQSRKRGVMGETFAGNPIHQTFAGVQTSPYAPLMPTDRKPSEHSTGRRVVFSLEPALENGSAAVAALLIRRRTIKAAEFWSVPASPAGTPPSGTRSTPPAPRGGQAYDPHRERTARIPNQGLSIDTPVSLVGEPLYGNAERDGYTSLESSRRAGARAVFSDAERVRCISTGSTSGRGGET